MGFDGQFAKFRADEVGLTSYIYYGTIIRDSRDFCVEHVNKIFTEEEARELWQRDWQGKSGSDPFLDRGGYNCRHHWQPVNPDWGTVKDDGTFEYTIDQNILATYCCIFTISLIIDNNKHIEGEQTMNDQVKQESVENTASQEKAGVEVSNNQETENKLFTADQLEQIVQRRLDRYKKSVSNKLDGIDIEEAKKLLQEKKDKELDIVTGKQIGRAHV